MGTSGHRCEGRLLPLRGRWSSEFGGAGAPEWPEVLGLARRAEEVGLDSLWVIDHLVLGNDIRTEFGLRRHTCFLGQM